MSTTDDVTELLEKYPSRPWTSENLTQVLQELLASNVVGDDSDSSIDATAYDGSDLDVLQRYKLPGRASRFSQLKSFTESEFQPSKSKRKKDKRKTVSIDTASDSSLMKWKQTLISTKLETRKISNARTSDLRKRASELADLGKINTRLMRKPKLELDKEELPDKIMPRINEMVDAIKTVAKYHLQPENIRDENEAEERIELNRLLKAYSNELDDFGIQESLSSQYAGPSIKGIHTFHYRAIQPKKHLEGKSDVCKCKTCQLNSLWVETKRKRADELAAVLGEPKKREKTGAAWNCQCKGPRHGFNNKKQMAMKIRLPRNMRPDELKKLNTVPRYEVHKHITPADNGKVNIKNAVIYRPELARPIIQQEMMCHTNEMRCVLLPPPFTGKVTKFETPDWVLEYNKRYVYDYFFRQTKNIPNVSFMHFSYKKNLAVLIEEIIQGCMNRTDIFDDDTCQCTFLCKCAHKTTKKPNATLFDTVRQAKMYCAADLHDDNVYEAGDYMKAGDKTYYVCSKLCNARMKLHKQLHV